MNKNKSIAELPIANANSFIKLNKFMQKKIVS